LRHGRHMGAQRRHVQSMYKQSATLSLRSCLPGALGEYNTCPWRIARNQSCSLSFQVWLNDSVALLLSTFLGLSVYPANQAILCGALIHFLHAAYGLANHFAIHHPAADNKQAGKPSSKTCFVQILLHVPLCLNAQFPVQKEYRFLLSIRSGQISR